MNPGPPDHLPPCFLNLNWDQAMDPGGHLESAFSSIVSSSQSSNSPVTAESLAFQKLIGGLQNIGNSGDEISPHSQYVGPPLNSPPILNLSTMGGGSHLHQHPSALGGLPAVSRQQLLPTHVDQFSADPAFAERAARFSSFDGRNYGQLAGQFMFPDSAKLPRAANGPGIGLADGNKEMLMQRGLQPEIASGELGNAREESSVSDPAGGEISVVAPIGSSSKKRKAPPKGKGKDTTNSATNPSKIGDEGESDAKRSRSVEDRGTDDSVKPKTEQNDSVSTSGNGSQNKNKESNAKTPEPPKDYIHVRARRGQATDSHSLAERVRREKISQRMKLLQDLVPGCNKVTGKAVMLDEIINYVQSLQRQVEFLSMKLATVNPRLDFNNLANLLPKDMSAAYSLDTSVMTPSYSSQSQQGNSLHCVLNNGMENQNSMHLLDSTFHQNLSANQPFLNGLENASSQLGTFWEDDFQSVVQMDLGQNQDIAASSQGFHGSMATTNMKIEL